MCRLHKQAKDESDNTISLLWVGSGNKSRLCMECPHISGEHAMLSGYWRRCPSFSIRSRVGGPRAGYGVLPTVNISQHVTPYDH